MRLILGIILIFAAAWLMVRLQAGSGSGSGKVYESAAADPEHMQGCKDPDGGMNEGSNPETERHGID